MQNFAPTPAYPREATRRVDESLQPTPREFNAGERRMELENEKMRGRL